MKSLVFVRYPLSIGAVAALLAGCALPPSLSKGQDDMPSITQARPAAGRTGTGWSHHVFYEFPGLHGRGSHPRGELLDVGGTLYGTTDGGGKFRRGTVYALTLRDAHTVLHAFGGGTSDGSSPNGGLIDVDGTLYGTTEHGGTSGAGTVYSISTSGSEKVLYNFTDGTDGGYPTAPLIDVNGTLYGTTFYGGDSSCNGGYKGGCGTIFSLSTSGSETVLYSFSGSPDGAYPSAGLLDVNGTLYGTASYGGASCKNFYDYCGVIYSLSTSGSEKVVYAFKGADDGSAPYASLIDVNGKLYGTTQFGGGQGCDDPSQWLGCGVVYSVTTTGTEKVLHRFCAGTNSDAQNPTTPLVDVNGTLYGTSGSGPTCANGEGGRGAIYSVTTAGAEKLLYTFTLEGGWGPSAGFINVNGTLYSTTYFGGRLCPHGMNGYKGCGTVFTFSR